MHVNMRSRTWSSLLALLLLGGLAAACVANAGADPRAQGWRKAQLTTYTSYPPCCEGSPAYDPRADKSECEDYSGCTYQGDFAVIGHRSFDWVKSHNIVAFYDDTDPDGQHFSRKYGGKRIKLRKNGREITALIADTCGNHDCDNCCRKNSKGGYLVDLEYWTARRLLGDPDQADGTIQFKILD